MKKILTLILTIVSLQSYAQVKIDEILGYEFNNQKNVLSGNVVGKESAQLSGSGQYTLVVVKLSVIPGQEYKYISRTLRITAYYEGDASGAAPEKREIKIPLVENSYFTPILFQKGPTGLTINAELYEETKLVSTKKQLLVQWSGD